jgi:hypothetical protein
MASVRHLGLFPWCVDPATSHFIEEDLLKYAVPMWWRVKEWTLNSTADVLANTEPPLTDTYSDSFLFKITDIPLRFLGTDTFQKEKDLVIAGKAETGFGTLGPAYDWSFDALLGDPEEDIALELTLTIGPAFEFRAFSGDTPPVATNGGGSQVGIITSNFCGLSFFAPIKRVLPFDESLYVITSLNATLTATAYWPYDPEDGKGPIYDSITGDQLRDFPS